MKCLPWRVTQFYPFRDVAHFFCSTVLTSTLEVTRVVPFKVVFILARGQGEGSVGLSFHYSITLRARMRGAVATEIKAIFLQFSDFPFSSREKLGGKSTHSSSSFLSSGGLEI